MRDQHISLQDIATLAGVTKMTVSRYLRTPHQVAKQTAERIASVIKEINYNQHNGRVHSQQYTIGVLIPSFQNLLFADLLAGIDSVTSVINYQVLTANYNYFQESEEKQVINLLSRHIHGIILCGKTHNVRTIKYLRSSGIPVVEVMDTQGDKLDMQVGFNNKNAAFDMINTMLATRPHRKIIYMGAKDDERDQQRFAGYCDALRYVRLTPFRINPQSISSIQLGEQLMQEALHQQADIDGVFCSNDDLAVGALRYCQHVSHIQVPEQIAIAGFHGLELGQAVSLQTTTRLASVITPRFDIGYTAVQLLRQRIENIPIITDSIDLGYQLYTGNTL